MKKRWLIPITLTTLTPLISMVGCSDNCDWTSWDYKEDGEFKKEIEYAPADTPKTDEAVNAAFMNWLKKDKNNFVYDYMLWLNFGLKYYEYTENTWSFIVHDFNYEKQAISFDVKADMEETDGDSLHIDLQYKNLKIEAFRYINDSASQITIAYWESGTNISIRNESKKPDVWSIIPTLIDDNDWKITGLFNNSKIEYDASTAQKAWDDNDSTLANNIIYVYGLFDHKSKFLEKVPVF